MDRNLDRGGNPPGANPPGDNPPGGGNVPPGGPGGQQPPHVHRRRPYAGAARISHTGNEFVIDFGDIDPDNPKVILMHSGIKMSPQTAKSLLIALRENLKKYETKYGKLAYPPDDADDIPDWSGKWN